MFGGYSDLGSSDDMMVGDDVLSNGRKELSGAKNINNFLSSLVKMDCFLYDPEEIGGDASSVGGVVQDYYSKGFISA